MKIIRIIECTSGQPTSFDGRYLQTYDPTWHLPDGKYDGGLIEVTPYPDAAMVFSDAGAALEKWRQPAGCRCHGIRPDGKPNRPLTAWTVCVEDAPIISAH